MSKLSNLLASRRQEYSYTLWFMVLLSLVCAIILASLASALKEPQELARELDRSKQMLIAARIINPDGYFQVQKDDGTFVPAYAATNGILQPSEQKITADNTQIAAVYKARIGTFLVNNEGKISTFHEAGLSDDKYLQEYFKTGYYRQPWKLLYKIYGNIPPEGNKERDAIGYVFPVNGMGLWDAIYGYLAIKTDANTVIGISWYDQKETPGLGGNISEPSWQNQFHGKHIFQESPDGKTNFKSAPLGITVVKGKVSELLGDSPKALSAVDGMAGATLTGNGVSSAYQDVLAAYRPFLEHVHNEYVQSH